MLLRLDKSTESSPVMTFSYWRRARHLVYSRVGWGQPGCKENSEMQSGQAMKKAPYQSQFSLDAVLFRLKTFVFSQVLFQGVVDRKTIDDDSLCLGLYVFK